MYKIKRKQRGREIKKEGKRGKENTIMPL